MSASNVGSKFLQEKAIPLFRKIATQEPETITKAWAELSKEEKADLFEYANKSAKLVKKAEAGEKNIFQKAWGGVKKTFNFITYPIKATWKFLKGLGSKKAETTKEAPKNEQSTQSNTPKPASGNTNSQDSSSANAQQQPAA